MQMAAVCLLMRRLLQKGACACPTVLPHIVQIFTSILEELFELLQNKCFAYNLGT
jgi:hypothetical protein